MTNQYDGFGRLTSTTLLMDGVSRALTYQYDAGSRRTRITHPGTGAPYFDYTYDARSRLTLVRENSTTWLDGFSFNSQGLVSEQSYNEVVGGFSAYSYDALGRPTSISHNLPNFGTNPDRDVSFGFGSRNPAGQIVSATRNNDTYAWAGHYAVTRAYATNGLNQYSQVGGVPYTYDANGNLISYTTPNGTQGFVYDIENRLVSASGVANNATLRYDPLGRLYEVSSAARTTRFLYDGDALVAEYDSAGNLVARYVHGSNAADDDPLVWYDGTNMRRFLISDQQGSIVAVSDINISADPQVSNTPSSAPLSVNTYDEYGIPGAGNVGRFQYTGQAWLPELGMYYYKARIYSPLLGRFMQTDPIGYADQFNLYEYVGDDPVNRSDPTGLYECIGSRLRCPGVQSDQAAAIQKLNGQLGTLRSLARDVAAGRRLNANERQAQSLMDQFLGGRAGHNVQAINQLVAAGESIMRVLVGRAPITTHPQVGTEYAHTRGGPLSPIPTYLEPRYFGASSAARQETLVHEASHKSLETRDYAHGRTQALRFAITHPDSTMRSADNIALALGFTRDDN